MNQKAIFFDLDNTLWDVYPVIVNAEQQLKTWLKTHVPGSLELYESDQLGHFRDAVIKEFPDKIHDLSFMRRAVLEKLFLHHGEGSTRAMDLAASAFSVFIDARNEITPFTAAAEVLRELSSDYLVVAVTNGNADVFRTPLAPYFQDAISSADAGCKKPDPRIFEIMLQRHGLTPESVVHIGDHLVDDIQGANEAGLHSIWVNLDRQSHDGAVQPASTVTCLTQIPASVAAIFSR